MYTCWHNKVTYFQLAGAVDIFGKISHFSFLRP
jgi:hypothetical protein